MLIRLDLKKIYQFLLLFEITQHNQSLVLNPCINELVQFLYFLINSFLVMQILKHSKEYLFLLF